MPWKRPSAAALGQNLHQLTLCPPPHNSQHRHSAGQHRCHQWLAVRLSEGQLRKQPLSCRLLKTHACMLLMLPGRLVWCVDWGQGCWPTTDHQTSDPPHAPHAQHSVCNPGAGTLPTTGHRTSEHHCASATHARVGTTCLRRLHTAGTGVTGTAAAAAVLVCCWPLSHLALPCSTYRLAYLSSGPWVGGSWTGQVACGGVQGPGKLRLLASQDVCCLLS